MDRLVELGQLLDWYGAFLTERQRLLVRLYAYEDLSLGEIADREGITRQAVRDAISTSEAELRDMEAKLGLIETKRKNAPPARRTGPKRGWTSGRVNCCDN